VSDALADTGLIISTTRGCCILCLQQLQGTANLAPVDQQDAAASEAYTLTRLELRVQTGLVLA
jgi:hypothetical protein